MSDVLNVEVRENMGTAATRKLRDTGRIPAVVYGHGGENQHLSVPRKEVELLLRHHSKHVQLAGAANDHVLLKDVQWDPLGIEVLHMDLLRVSLSEKVTITVPVKLHGVAIGLNHHGVMNEILHSVEINVPALKIPEFVELNVNDLDVGQSKTAADIELPEGAELTTDPTAVVVQMNAPAGDKATDEDAEAATEPEVIGAKKEDENE
ncbi:50S ribosomal protein L25 [Rosistilla oblonga]|uniref:Large ribosomal subunit protein bL25 n=1 Tax=Rosistilla oblonga TaxID=2527990 RepID=A0A518IR92_9BACT|nr:50S ribosomal protein L25 [Rosistilla oblonga]QDV55609.1 50S ribosomal protein L25 [Rosistilla oblonga]